MMKRTIMGLAAASVLASTAGAASAGCLGGAVVGGVGGHFVHHPVLGAVGGCIVGHHMAVVHKRQMRAQRMATYGH
ncbi:hypothetical protein [Caulobacter sp. S45]|uniref:hypothetical protein n=1 Tax=Caulobacter sp. S45 TaxID=1641861 RepID=UPI001C2CD63F|nr:hypothetical protein [Caulobacter sp. S45]